MNRLYKHVLIRLSFFLLVCLTVGCSKDPFRIRLTAQESGYGYQILYRGKVKIDQPFIPVLSEKHSFESEKDAEKAARWVVERIRQNQDYTMTKEDLIKLNISINSNP